VLSLLFLELFLLSGYIYSYRHLPFFLTVIPIIVLASLFGYEIWGSRSSLDSSSRLAAQFPIPAISSSARLIDPDLRICRASYWFLFPVCLAVCVWQNNEGTRGSRDEMNRSGFYLWILHSLYSILCFSFPSNFCTPMLLF
jgi:hypothetical protein